MSNSELSTELKARISKGSGYLDFEVDWFYLQTFAVAYLLVFFHSQDEIAEIKPDYFVVISVLMILQILQTSIS